MEVATPTDAPDGHGARNLSRSEMLHPEVKLSCFFQGEPGLHPGGLFSHTSVMAAMTMVAIMAAKCLDFDIQYLSNQSEF